MSDSTFSPPKPASAAEKATPLAEVDLRPLTTSELIDRGFSLYRAHFAGFLLLALLSQLAPLLSQIIIASARLAPTQTEIQGSPLIFGKKMGIILAINITTLLVVFCFEIVATFFISDAYLGKIPSVTDCFRKFTTFIGSSIWTCGLNMVLVGLTFLFPFGAAAASYFYELIYTPTTFGSILVFAIVSFLLFVASLAPVLIVFMRLWVIVPALALEGLAGWKAVKRSITLVRYDPGLGILYWGEMRLSFLLLPLFIIDLLILSITSLPLVVFQVGDTFHHGSAGQIATPPGAILIVSQILTYLAGSLIWPLYSIATTLFYYDVRIRREGFDLEFMAERLGGGK